MMPQKSLKDEKAKEKPFEEPGLKIARLLVEEGILTEEQLSYARRVHAKLTSSRTLTQVLYDLDYINPEQLRGVLHAHRPTLRIGELLVELGAITQEQLQMALGIQKQSGVKKRIGDILIEARVIRERDFIETLSFQLGIPYLEPNISQISSKLLRKASRGWYATHQIIPVGESNGRPIIAFVDPLDEKAMESAKALFGTELNPAICSGSCLKEALLALERQERGVRVEVEESQVVGIVHAMIDDALRMNASDIHIEPLSAKLRIRFRVDGVLIHYKDLDPDLAPPVTNRLKILARLDIAERRRHQGGRILYDPPHGGASVDLRISFYVTVWGENIVLRVLNRGGQLIRMEEIGMLPKTLERFRFDALDSPTGVILITGPTGSGKTTTLYSCVAYLDRPDTCIITVEDPVEYVINGIAQCSIDPRINLTFDETLRHIVRQDPDIIVVGEIRDQFSAETCIQASLTGHKVLSTFHTEDSIGGLIRLLNMNIEAFLISSTVICVVAQRLLRKICPKCREPYSPSPVDLHRLGYTTRDVSGINFSVGKGCPACRYTGYRGRVGIFELLVLNETVKDAILSRKTSYEIRKISVETSGLVTLLEDGLIKASLGETSLQEILRYLPRVTKPRAVHELSRFLGV